MQKEYLIETRSVTDEKGNLPVSASESRAREMLRSLIKNAVTPVCLLEIVDDMMSLESGQAS